MKYNLITKSLFRRRWILLFRSFFITGLLSSLYMSAIAQDESEDTYNSSKGVHFGFNAGAAYSKIININTIIISEPYFNKTDYRLWDNWKPRYPHVGAFIDYNVASWFYVSAELGYDDEGGNVRFHNSMDYNYAMDFNYQYINVIPMIGVRPLNWLYFAVGAQYGLNVAENQIYFKTLPGPGYEPAFGTDPEQQQQLRNVLKGKDEFGATAVLGFIVWNKFGIETRYHRGTKNVVEVEDNSYNFVPQQCLTYSVELLLTYRLPLHSNNK